MKILKIFLLSFLIFSFNKVYALSYVDVEESSFNSDISDFLVSNNISYFEMVNHCDNLRDSSYKYYFCSLDFNNYLYMYIFQWNSTEKFNFIRLTDNRGTASLVLGSNNTENNVLLSSFQYSLSSNSFSFSSSVFDNGNYAFYYKDSSHIYEKKFTSPYYLDGLFYTNIDYQQGFNFISSSSSTNLNFTLQGKNYSVDETPILPFTFWNSSSFKNWVVPQPSYKYSSTILDNGNVKLDFTFNNYNDSSSIYGFTITNEVSGEEYGIENPFSSIFPNIIPFGSSYSIEVPYDTYIYITLAKYEKYENSELYYRTELYTDTIDINNVVFSNPQDTYFQLLYSSQNNLTGIFKNTSNDSTCYFVRSNNLDVETEVSCSEQVSVDVNFNGYVKFYVKQKDNIIYSRNINVLGNSNSFLPFIIYSVDKQDFYSVITWSVANQNFDSNMKFRYSLDNGNTFTPWVLIDSSTNFNINIFENSIVIIEISNNDNSTIYDSKSISVVVDISTIKDFNNTTNNFINKFISIFSVNSNILKNVNIFWNSIKTSKLYLVIFIPFLGALICGIIYLIRRD